MTITGPCNALDVVDVVALGESMVTFLPSRPGRLADVPSFERAIGGAESNVACGLAAAGHAVRWVSRVGADGFGDHLVEVIGSYGVDVTSVGRDPQRPTGVYFRTAGDRATDAHEVAYYRAGSAASAMSAQNLDLAAVHAGRVLHLSGITAALSDDCRELMRELTARRAERPLVSFDVNYRPGLWRDGSGSRVLLELARRADVVFVGEDEAEAAWGITGGPAAVRAALPEPQVLVVKQGGAGATAFVSAAGGGGPVAVAPTRQSRTCHSPAPPGSADGPPPPAADGAVSGGLAQPAGSRAAEAAPGGRPGAASRAVGRRAPGEDGRAAGVAPAAQQGGIPPVPGGAPQDALAQAPGASAGVAPAPLQGGTPSVPGGAPYDAPAQAPAVSSAGSCAAEAAPGGRPGAASQAVGRRAPEEDDRAAGVAPAPRPGGIPPVPGGAPQDVLAQAPGAAAGVAPAPRPGGIPPVPGGAPQDALAQAPGASRSDRAEAASAPDADESPAIFVPALDVDVVAAVGAGDAFAAGFLSATLRELPVRDRLRHGHLWAAATLTAPGDLAAPPARDTADRLVALDDAGWEKLRLGPGWTQAAERADEEVRTP